MLVDEQKDELYSVIAVGDTAEILKSARLKIGEGITGWVAKHGESIIVPDVYTNPRFAQHMDEMAKWKIQSIVCVPLQTGGRVLVIDRREETLRLKTPKSAMKAYIRQVRASALPAKCP